jgi:Ca2+-binding RTX toxin-like protein
MGGNDLISSGTGDDVIYGGTGNDSIYGGSGSDYCYGEEGNDRYGFNKGEGTIRIFEYAGVDQGTDDIIATDYTDDELFFSLDQASNSLIFANASGSDQIILSGWFDNFGVERLELVSSSGSTFYDLQELLGITGQTANAENTMNQQVALFIDNFATFTEESGSIGVSLQTHIDNMAQTFASTSVTQEQHC